MLRSFILVVLCALAAGFSPAKVEDNLYCDACVEVAKELESQGCDLACDLIPAPYAAMALNPSNGRCSCYSHVLDTRWNRGDLICSWILDMTDLCQELINKLSGGETPTQACTDIGLCGSACECGVCTQDAAGPDGRCLGAPNDCGHQTPALPSWARDAIASSDATENVGFCLDGQCDGTPANIGCCLTCF